MLSKHNKDSESVAPTPVEEPAQSEVLTTFKLQPDLPTTTSSSLDDLLRYHDRPFVERVYAVVARRKPTHSELSQTLEELRSGDKTKVEIVEKVVASQAEDGAPVVIEGLPSPTLRKLGRWPVIGPIFRILRSVIRLPVMMQDQQRFESYALAQQQRLADFLNEQVVSTIHRKKTNGVSDLHSTGADVVETVVMLSDSVVELAAKQTELAETVSRSQGQLEQLSNQWTHVSTQLTTLEAAQRQLQSQAEQLSREPQELQTQIAAVIKQREQSETQFRDDLLRLTQAVEGLNNEAASQREFLIQEQRLIVETQKVALNELQTQISETEQRTRETLESLAAIVRGLQRWKKEQS